MLKIWFWRNGGFGHCSQEKISNSKGNLDVLKGNMTKEKQ
jgi:hypothetical protein